VLLLVADENFNNNVVRGLLYRRPDLDIVRVQDVGLENTSDEEILEWAAKENRILLTHDAATITKYAFDRVRAGQKMPGVIEMRRSVSIGVAIEDILLLAEASQEDEMENKIIYLPLK